MLVELLHVVAGRAEILAGVKFGGLLGENLAHGSSHGQTAVRVDIDLAYRALGSLAELFFRDTDSVGELAAILVDGVNFVLGTDDEPWSTMGNPGSFSITASSTSKANGGGRACLPRCGCTARE